MGELSIATLLMVVSAAAAFAQTTCLPAISACLRGAGTLQRFEPEDAPSLTGAACCAACAQQRGCTAWQLYAVDSAEQACWLLPTFAIKPSDPGVSCSASAIPAPPNPARVNHSGYAGIWVQHGDTAALLNQSFVLGSDVSVDWADVEVGDDEWDWAATDMGFARQAAAGFYIETALTVGPKAPMWLYKDKEAGGGGITPTRIRMAEGHKCANDEDDGDTAGACNYPPYLDQQYQAFFLRAVDRFAVHIASLPYEVRSKIIASQAEYGSTGDDCPWHGTPVDPKDDICFKPGCPRVGAYQDAWHNFTMSTAPAICASYRTNNVSVLWNTNASRLAQLVKECPGSYIKAGMVSHGFSLNGEADNYAGKGKICHTEGYHCRGESWPFCQHGYYTEAPLWATYSHLLWQLTFGVDLPGLSQPNLINASYAPLYELFNRYAGSIRPPADEWAGGIIALRDGLDSANVSRFPEAQFGVMGGGEKKTTVARLLAIAAKFSRRGAVERDPLAATMSAMGSRRRNGTNDVGIRSWQGNYGNGLVTQLRPFETSIGWWHVGPRDQPYGRYARAFEAASGRTDLGFVLDARLWGGLPLSAAAARKLVLAVTYLDGKAGFDVYFDTAAGCAAPKRSIAGGGTGRWITATFAVADGHFGRRCASKAGQADIVLRSTTAGADAIVHGLQIYDPAHRKS